MLGACGTCLQAGPAPLSRLSADAAAHRKEPSAASLSLKVWPYRLMDFEAPVVDRSLFRAEHCCYTQLCGANKVQTQPPYSRELVQQWVMK